MPFHFVPTSRRRFLGAAAATVIAGASAARAGQEVEDDLVYVLNDTHVGEKHPPESPVPSHLRQVVDELVGRARRPAGVLINGDLALKDGQPGDYHHFGRLIDPLREAHINVHLTLGNHDNREAFYQVLKHQRPENPPVESRHISVVRTRYANFFLLDSLQKTMITPGTLGSQQRDWLAQALDAHVEKPAIIVTHHNPRLGGDPRHFPGGLVDSQPLWDILEPRRQVKAFIHGHIHDRSLAHHGGIHIINTPATSYVADPQKSTTGWTLARLTPRGVTLTTCTTDPTHAWHGQSQTLSWR